MKTKRTWKYYLRFYVMIVAVYFLYVSILALRDGGYDIVALWSVLYLPPLFVAFVAVFDTLFAPLFRRLNKGKAQDEGLDAYLRYIDRLIRSNTSFSMEEYGRLRRDDRFQKALRQAYQVKTKGDTPDLNLTLLQQKFKKQGLARSAFEVVLNDLETTRENR
jgi:hypothetical protein